MIKFKRYPYRVGETYGMNGGLTQRQITMAINKPVRQAKKLQKKAPLLAELITDEPIKDFDAQAEYERRQANFDNGTQKMRNSHAIIAVVKPNDGMKPVNGFLSLITTHRQKSSQNGSS